MSFLLSLTTYTIIISALCQLWKSQKRLKSERCRVCVHDIILWCLKLSCRSSECSHTALFSLLCLIQHPDVETFMQDVRDVWRMSTLIGRCVTASCEFTYRAQNVYFNLFTFTEPAVSLQNTITLHVILRI